MFSDYYCGNRINKTIHILLSTTYITHKYLYFIKTE